MKQDDQTQSLNVPGPGKPGQEIAELVEKLTLTHGAPVSEAWMTRGVLESLCERTGQSFPGPGVYDERLKCWVVRRP